MRKGWLEGTTNMWPAGLLLCKLTLHSINLPLFPTYVFFLKEEGSLVKNALEEVVKTASPRRGVMQLRMQHSRRATSTVRSVRGEECVSVCVRARGGKVCVRVSGPEAPKDVTHTLCVQESTAL